MILEDVQILILKDQTYSRKNNLVTSMATLAFTVIVILAKNDWT